jgi:hypothetical protein
MSRIDRIFCTTEFEEKFALAHARALPRVGSDRTPIIWETGYEKIHKKLVLNLKSGVYLDLNLVI